jgi:hypothetical protein
VRNVDRHRAGNHVPTMGTNITPFRQAIRAKTAPNRRQAASAARKPLRAPPLVRRAIELMVWEGHHRDDAAKAVGMLAKSLYNAFRKHHVRQYYREQLQVLRTSEMARNIHALVRIRDQDQNKMAAVAAARPLMRDDDMPPAGSGPLMTPGFTIVIEQPRPPALPQPIIDVTPLRRPE